MTLAERIEQALTRMTADGITGWGLDVFDDLDELGEFVQVGPSEGCTSDTCNHVSHDPAAPEYKWVPREGLRLVRLGNDGEDDYYVLLRDDEALFMRLIKPSHFHARLRVIAPDRVPDYLLAAAVAGG